MINFPLLKAEDIEVKVKQVIKTGALLLLYKTARTDAKILDETVGPMNWECQYAEIKGNLYCGVGIREKEDQSFVWKWDCGIESDQDDGQEKKAEASDAFKRACSRLGIGRELYSSPKIWADLPTVETAKGDKYVLKDKKDSWYVSQIKYDEKTKTIIDLEIRSAKEGNVVWTMEPTKRTLAAAEDLDFGVEDKSAKTKKTPTKTEKEVKEVKETKKVEEKPTVDVDSETGEVLEKEDLTSVIREIGNMVKRLQTKEGSAAKYKDIVKEVTGGTTFKCNVATEADYDTVVAIRNKLIASGYGE